MLSSESTANFVKIFLGRMKHEQRVSSDVNFALRGLSVAGDLQLLQECHAESILPECLPPGTTGQVGAAAAAPVTVVSAWAGELCTVQAFRYYDAINCGIVHFQHSESDSESL